MSFFLRKLLGWGEPTPAQPKAEETEPEQRPPQPEPVVPSDHSRIKVGWGTDVGVVRSHNEDTALVITAVQDGDEETMPFGLFILADGMGGHRSGEVASSLAARSVAQHIIQQFYLPTIRQKGQEHNADQPTLNEVLIEAAQTANRAVATEVPGGGTTLTYALVVGPQAYIAHVGDSRAYIITDNGLKQITHDHSLVDRLVRLGQLTADEAAVHPQKNVLYRAIGQEGELEVDTHMHALPEGGRLLLCSDGLWGALDAEDVLDIITKAVSPQTACEELIDAANQAGGRDNIAVILLESPFG